VIGLDMSDASEKPTGPFQTYWPGFALLCVAAGGRQLFRDGSMRYEVLVVAAGLLAASYVVCIVLDGVFYPRKKN
jgi:hypothetical protein